MTLSASRPAFIGEGGSIPFMAMLGAKFPKTQFVVTGVLGPHSNAHGPNEFLHIPFAKKISACIASILADHGVAQDELSFTATMTPSAPARRPLLVFILVTLAVGAAASAFSEPAIPRWYAGLVHPSYRAARLDFRAGLDRALCA